MDHYLGLNFKYKVTLIREHFSIKPYLSGILTDFVKKYTDNELDCKTHFLTTL